MSTGEKRKFIDRDMIKYLAIIPMAVGHFVAYLNDGVPDTDIPFILFILRNLSLFAPPVFFFFIAEGFRYTRSRKKYAVRLLIFAFINQIPFCLANHMTLLTTEIFRMWNIVFTLFLSLICLMIWESRLKLPLKITFIVIIDILTLVIFSEWMIFGILIVLCFHIFREKPKMRLICYSVLILLNTVISSFGTTLFFAVTGGVIRFGVMLLAYYLLMNHYSGEKGRHPVLAKWFFYIFYPAHLFAIYILLLIRQ